MHQPGWAGDSNIIYIYVNVNIAREGVSRCSRKIPKLPVFIDKPKGNGVGVIGKLTGLVLKEERLGDFAILELST